MKYAALLCLVLSFAACDDEKNDTLDCDTLDLSYDSFASSFMDSYCTTCHSQSLTGAERESAPTGIDFDTQTEVLDQLTRIRVRTVDQRSMPPFRSVDKPSDEEIASLANWIECGAP